MQGGVSQKWSLSLVIPAFNEEAGIARAIAEAADALHELAGDYEILVVDDGSTDRTRPIAEEAAQKRPRVRILHHENNRGYGAALRTGFEAARFDRVAFTDADCQFDLHDLDRLVPLAEHTPIIAGYRQNRQDSFRRKFLSRGYNFLVRLLLGTRVRDCDCALKVFRRDALSHLLPESANFFVNTEMLARARQQNLNVMEVPVTHRPRRSGRSKVSLSDVPKTLVTLLPFWWSRVLFSTSSQSNLTPQPPSLLGKGGRGVRFVSPPTMELFLVLALAAVFFFSRLHTPLLEPEEGRYAEIPRQMLAEGSWLVPILHGQPYLDKPPLLYWLVMASYSLFGVHDWAARLVPGVAGLLTIAVSYFWARRTAGNRAAILGSGMLCLSAEFLYYGRMLTMNGLLALFVTATLAFTHFALQATGKRKQLAWIALAGLACGFGLLTKGPVILAVVVPPLLLLPRLDQRLHRPGFAGWSLFAGATFLIAAPWYLAVCFRDPEFAGYFFWRHNITRFVQPFDHAGPVWEYLPGLLFGMMPWTLLIFPMFRALFQHSGEAAKRRPAALGMFLLAFLWMFVFFSLAGSKRPGYIVPVLPPLALALGCYLDSILDKRGGIGVAGAISALRSRMAYAATVIMLAAGIGLAVLSRRIGGSSQGAAWMLAIACGLSLVVALYHIRKARFPWLTPTLITAIVLFAGIQNLLPQYARRFSVRHAIEMQQHRITSPEMRVICYPHGFDSASFYLERGDVSSFARDRRAVMVARLEENPKALLMVQTRHLPEFLAKLPPTLEFIPLQKEEMITIGEVRRREEVPHFWLAERSPSAKQR